MAMNVVNHSTGMDRADLKAIASLRAILPSGWRVSIAGPSPSFGGLPNFHIEMEFGSDVPGDGCGADIYGNGATIPEAVASLREACERVWPKPDKKRVRRA